MLLFLFAEISISQMEGNPKASKVNKKRASQSVCVGFNQKKMNALMTHSENAYNSETDTEYSLDFEKEIKNPKDVSAIDIVFLIDTTGSMNAYIAGVKRFLRKVMRDAEAYISNFIKTEDVVRFGIVLYRDYSDNEYVTQVIDLDTRSNVKSSLNAIVCKGGDDSAEAVLAGIEAAVTKISWREQSEKFIFHALDAPPHGVEYGADSDTQAESLNTEDVLLSMREQKIDYNIIKLGAGLEKMIQVFETVYGFDVYTPEIKPDSSAAVSQ